MSPSTSIAAPGRSRIFAVRRLVRYAFHAITLLSPILCLATAILWMRNRHTEEAVIYRSRHSMSCAGVCTGRVLLSLYQDMDFAREDLGFNWWSESRPQRLPADGWDDTWADYQTYAWRGFSYEWNASGDCLYRGVTVPAWFAVLSLSLLPALWVRRHRRRRIDAARKVNGCCRTCGYDLRVSPRRCPECGTAVMASAAGMK